MHKFCQVPVRRASYESRSAIAKWRGKLTLAERLQLQVADEWQESFAPNASDEERTHEQPDPCKLLRMWFAR
jgi:hypothetical protein